MCFSDTVPSTTPGCINRFAGCRAFYPFIEHGFVKLEHIWICLDLFKEKAVMWLTLPFGDAHRSGSMPMNWSSGSVVPVCTRKIQGVVKLLDLYTVVCLSAKD